jgi:steroid delta-isomerase-like uncharacterized protein
MPRPEKSGSKRRKSMSEENKALVRRFFEEVWNKGNMSVIDEIIDSDFVQHDPAEPEEMRGPEGVRQFVQTNRSAFPDFRITVEDQVAEGDKVVNRFRISGTHQGELEGIAPTGNQVDITGISIDRIEGDKYVETWVNYDALGMMQQIGAIPEPGQAGS